MKSVLLVLSAFVSFSAFADGIPVPMNQQTPYNWMCKGGLSLHLIEQPGYGAQLYVSENGTTIGVKVAPKSAQLLKTKSYKGLETDAQEFESSIRVFEYSPSNHTVAVTMTDIEKKNAEKYVVKAKGCKATF